MAKHVNAFVADQLRSIEVRTATAPPKIAGGSSGRFNVEMQFRELWRGDLPLGQAFWEYAIAYGTVANIVATGAAIAAATRGLPDVIAVCLFLSPLPWR